MGRSSVAIASGLAVLLAAPAASTTDPHAIVRGMTVSCPRAGQAWGSDAMVSTMQKLSRLGVNWIAIHPYAGISPDGTVGGTRMSGLYRDPGWLTRPIEEAHRLGLKIMIKPHIAYWGSQFSWRGEIEFDGPERDRFFETYEAWIAMVAELTREADALSIGTELSRMVRHEAEWRRIIRSVRQRTGVPLTYSAQWDRFEDVPFWDALDVIGIQAYFPLVDHDLVPTEAELDDAWRRLVARLERVSRTHGRRILFTELGYNLSDQAARRPWEYREGGANAETVQRRCLSAALRAIESSPEIVGAFLWKWFPGERDRSNFLKSTPSMQRVIADHWGPNASPRP